MKLKTSKTEIRDILKAWIAISVAFAILLSKGIFSTSFSTTFLIATLTVGLGFLIHELSHKITAQHFHYSAEFRANNTMLLLAIAMSFFGFILAAPGAVIIKAYNITKRKNGIISLAGPLSNIILAIIFLIIPLQIFPTYGILISTYGVLINSWLAVFNLIPILNLDGKKILNWDKRVYFITLIVAISLLFL